MLRDIVTISNKLLNYIEYLTFFKIYALLLFYMIVLYRILNENLFYVRLRTLKNLSTRLASTRGARETF